MSVISGGENRLELSIPINNHQKINSYGAGVSLRTRLFNNYKVGLNYNWNNFDDSKKDSEFLPQFNTSEHNIKFMLGNDNVFKNIGFNVARWQNGYRWVSPFGIGDIDARTLVDGHIAIPKMKSRFKVGTNLLGKPYLDNIGNAEIGSVYYFTCD